MHTQTQDQTPSQRAQQTAAQPQTGTPGPQQQPAAIPAFTRLISRCVALDQEHIDTDQIIPARFLTATSFTGLGQHAFADWRYDTAGQPRPECPLNQPQARHRQILVAGHNFGCGSSREHAPRALLAFGFRVVISSRIADIFRNNAWNCGLLPLELGRPEARWLLDHPDDEVIVDLAQQYVELAAGHRCTFSIDPFARHCLLQGLDPLGFIQAQAQAIGRYEAHREARCTGQAQRNGPHTATGEPRA